MHWRCTEHNEVSGTGMKVCTDAGSLYRYRRYRYPCRTELTEMFSTGIIEVVPNLPKCSVPVIPAVYTGCMPRCVPYRTHHPCKHVQQGSSFEEDLFVPLCCKICRIERTKTPINSPWVSNDSLSKEIRGSDVFFFLSGTLKNAFLVRIPNA